MRISASGDTAVIVEFGNEVSRELSNLVLSANATLARTKIHGVIETIPTFRSLMVQYDPLLTTSHQLIAEISPLLNTLETHQHQIRKWCVPVCYEADYAADITTVAKSTGCSIEEIIQLHSDMTYHVYMLGFLPGFPYLGDLDASLHLPRRTNPRTRVPKGSISIATSLTSIYPFESPGGWHLIGTTPIILFDADKKSPALFTAGDQIKFTPVSPSEFIRISQQAATGEYCLTPEVITS